MGRLPAGMLAFAPATRAEMLGSPRVEICGSMRNHCRPHRRFVGVCPYAGLSRHAPSSPFPACYYLRQQRCLHHDPCVTSSALHRSLRANSLDPPTDSKVVGALAPTCRPRAEWPANILERVRRELSAGHSSPKSSLQDRWASPLYDRTSFISWCEMQQQLQKNNPRAFLRRLMRAISHPFSGAEVDVGASFGALDGTPQGTDCSPVVYKRYIDGMTAAHHYPSRLLPPHEAAKLPPLFFVTPFGLHEDPSPSAETQDIRLRERVFRPSSPGAILPKTSLVERLYGRVSLLFLFDVGGQHSQLADVATWVRRLESHSSFISSVYGPVFASPTAATSAAAVATGSLPPGLLQQPCPGLGWRADGTGPELASLQFICVDHAPFWLRSLAIRSMQSLTPSFRSLLPFHSFPQRLRRAARIQEGPREVPQDSREAALRLLAEEYEHLCSLIRSRAAGSCLFGSFMGYSGRWGAEEVETFKRRERAKFVSVLLVDKAARVRWHATGSPTEEAVMLLLSGLKALLAEDTNATACIPRVHVCSRSSRSYCSYA